MANICCVCPGAGQSVPEKEVESLLQDCRQEDNQISPMPGVFLLAHHTILCVVRNCEFLQIQTMNYSIQVLLMLLIDSRHPGLVPMVIQTKVKFIENIHIYYGDSW